MKNKGFTLVELILVIVIMGIISAIVIPSIMKGLSDSEKQGGKSVEELLINNLKLYNDDNKFDIWCSENNDAPGCKKVGESQTVSIEDLYAFNPDINMGECLLQDANSLSITNTEKGFKYTAKIFCSKNYTEYKDDQTGKIVASAKYNTMYKNSYYYTPKELDSNN